MVQVGNGINYPEEEESVVDYINKMVGSRSHGQLVQISRANEVIPVGGRTVKVGPIVTQVGANSVYAATDAFGDKFKLEGVPKSGIIQSVRWIDPDDDTFTLTVHLFSEDFTETADNSVYAVADDEYLKLEASILIDTFRDTVVSKIGIEDNLGIAYTAPSGSLWGQAQLQTGTPTIAAGVKQYLVLYILADE